MNHLASQVMLLARFLCFMAVFYLALHNVLARLSRNSEGKILWFFDVLTAPLTRPVRAWHRTVAALVVGLSGCRRAEVIRPSRVAAETA